MLDTKILLLAIGLATFPMLGAERPGGHSHKDHHLRAGVLRSPEAPPPAGYEAVDHTFVIGAMPNVMKFDVEKIQVAPGAKVKLVLRNADQMQHNLLICRPGDNVVLDVARAAWALGTEALERNFVPDSPLVLHHTSIVDPGQADTLYFTAPMEEEDYPYVCTLPGHAFTMRGVMRVGRGGATPAPAPAAGTSGGDPHRYHVYVHAEPRVVRCVMPDSSSRSIAVGLPGGINYCFDAQGCYVRYGWFGAFLDTGPDRGRLGPRGGAPNEPLGQRFSVGATGFPLRLGSEVAPVVQFLGYRRTDAPQFRFRVDGIDVTQTITPAARGIGLTYAFEFSQTPPADVQFAVDERHVQCSASAGSWSGGILTVPAADARRFSVTLVEIAK